jgi:hypothetical protein
MTSLHALILSVACLAAGVVLRVAAGEETMSTMLFAAATGGLAGAWGMERQAKKAESKEKAKERKRADDFSTTATILRRENADLRSKLKDERQPPF